ncbi:MAG: hypothetical protein AAFY15_12675, partial [Cyanobacteria bacterium J06648_11]
HILDGHSLLGNAEVEAVVVAQELREVEELGYQLAHVLQVLLSRRVPRLPHVLEEPDRLVEATALEGQGRAAIGFQAYEVVEYVAISSSGGSGGLR